MSKADIATLKFHISKYPNARQDNLINLMFDLLLSVCAFLGFGGIFCKVFGISINAPAVIICVCVSSAVQLFFRKKLRLTGLILPALSSFILTVFCWDYLINGFIYTANSILNTTGCRFSKIMPQLERISNTNEKTSQTLFLIAISIILSYAVIFSLKNNDIIIPLILSVLSAAVCVIFETKLSFIIICPAALFVIGVIFKKLSGNLVSILSFISCLAICIICTLILSLFGIEDNSEINILNQFKNHIINEINDLRYGESYIMPEGDFKNLSAFNPSGKQQLEVIMSKPDSLYLRGFIGESYCKNGWQKLDSTELYKSSDLFYWLHKEGFYGQTQLSEAASLFSDTSSDVNNITINNIGTSRKYIYAPYEVINTDNELLNESTIGDSALIASGFKGKKLYSFTASENLVKAYPSLIQGIKQSDSPEKADYLNNESHYREFVYNSYLGIPESTKNILETQLGEYDSNKNGRLDYSTAQQNILSFLSSKITYNPDSAFSGSNDFLQYFLEQSCEGYSVHYATAAALMFRYYGIPARYTEGYLITPQDSENAFSNSPVNIDDTHFHAWAEFYRDGVGWIPFETTPPYLDVMEKAEEIAPLSDRENHSDNEDSAENNRENTQQGEIQSTKIADNNIIKHIIIIIVILTLTALSAFIVICITKRQKLNKKLKSFELFDNKTCVKTAFAYVIDLLKVTKLLENENQLYISDSTLYNKIDTLSEQIKSSLFIYEKANFSSHEISEYEKETVLSLVSDVTDKIKKENTIIKNTVNRFIRCIYK